MSLVLAVTFFFFFPAPPHSLQDLSSPTRDWTRAHGSESTESLIHWTAREFPGSDFLNTTPKAWSMKEITDMLDFIKIRNFCSAKDMSKEWEDKPQTEKKYLQKTYVIKDCYPKHTKKLLNLNNKKTKNSI